MKYTTKFVKKDILVIFGCVVFLLMNIGAIGDNGRRRAKEMVCLSNLRQWGAVFQMHIESNDGYFIRGTGKTSYWWIKQLDDHYKDWKSMRIWFCPTAKRPTFDENGVMTPSLDIFNAWGIFYGEGHSPNGAAGSYGLNGYLIGQKFEGRNNVPVFVDALRFDLWPQETDPPTAYEFAAWSSNNMARCCINRHNGAINTLFADWSSRKIGLKQLWTLNWHSQFDTKGPWTIAGGVQPSDWPEWMRNFSDY
jgi:prepilin-type processing-associated H-X9-DG protein